MSKQIDCICVVFNRFFADHTKSVKLMPQSSFTDHKLCGICSIQTIDAIGPRHTILHRGWLSLAVPIVEEPSRQNNIFCNSFESCDYILISASEGKLHQFCNAEEILAFLRPYSYPMLCGGSSCPPARTD